MKLSVFKKHLSGVGLKNKLCFTCACASVSFLIFTDYFYLVPAATSVLVTLCLCSPLDHSVPNSWSLSYIVLHIVHVLLTPAVWISPPDPSLFCQRKSWTWTRVTGKTFMSSQEPWNFSFASFLSPWCPSASSPTLWRQSVSEQLQPHSISSISTSLSPHTEWHQSN